MARKGIALVLCLMLLTVCAHAEGGLTVTDMAGREVALSGVASRIVVLDAADCEILCALGASDALVGRGEYCDYPAEVADIAAVSSGYETNVEQIIALEPQVVVMSVMAQGVEVIDQLESAGIRVVETDAQDIAGVYEAIALLGAVTGKDAEAESLVAGMKAAFEELAQKAAGAARGTVYFEVSPLAWGLWTAGSGTFMNELAEMLGFENAFADVTGWAEISQEQVIERDPDYIVTITVYGGEGETPAEEICARAGWQDMKAVVNGNVFNVSADEISRPGPRLTDAARALDACADGANP